MADNTDNSPVAAAAAATRNEYNVSQTTNPADASIHSSSTAPKQTSEPMTTSEPNPAGASIQSPSTAPKEAPVPTTTTTSEQNPAPQQQQPGQVDTDAPGREQAEKTVEPGDDGPKHPVENAPDEDSEETKQHKAKGETWTGASWIKFDKVKPGDPEMSSGKELQGMYTYPLIQPFFPNPLPLSKSLFTCLCTVEGC